MDFSKGCNFFRRADNESMKKLIFFAFLFSQSLGASVVGVTTYPLNEEARVFSAEMTGYMSERNEMGAGLRYTHEIERFKRLDFTVSGGQDSRALNMGTGVDLELLSEDVYQPRISFKPYFQYEKFEAETSTYIGGAPTIRKGVAINGQELFPYLAIPSGMKLDSDTNEFAFYSSLSLGASMPFPGVQNERVLLSLEGNVDLGSTSDYLGCLVSWMWN